MFKRFLLLGSVLTVGACSYATDTSIQDVEITAPGARGSVCFMYVDGLKYKVYPPQSITVTKSKEDLVVDCLAPGNRRKKVVIEPEIADSFYGNVGNAFVGAPWDIASAAMFKYPDTVEVNFEHTPIVPEAVPAQNAPDIKQPEEYPLEEFGPSVPRLNSDLTRPPIELKRRERPTYSYRELDYSDATTGGPSPDISELQQIIESLGVPEDPTPMAADTNMNYDSMDSPQLDAILDFLNDNE